jgi:hypothetical protein
MKISDSQSLCLGVHEPEAPASQYRKMELPNYYFPIWRLEKPDFISLITIGKSHDRYP